MGMDRATTARDPRRNPALAGYRKPSQRR